MIPEEKYQTITYTKKYIKNIIKENIRWKLPIKSDVSTQSSNNTNMENILLLNDSGNIYIGYILNEDNKSYTLLLLLNEKTINTANFISSNIIRINTSRKSIYVYISDDIINLINKHKDNIDSLFNTKRITVNTVEFKGYETLESIVQSDGTTFYHHYINYGNWYNMYNDRLENVTETFGYIKAKWYVPKNANEQNNQYVITLNKNPHDAVLTQDIVVNNDFHSYPGLVVDDKKWFVNSEPCYFRYLDNKTHTNSFQDFYSIWCKDYTIVYQIDENTKMLFPKYISPKPLTRYSYNLHHQCFEINELFSTKFPDQFDMEGFICYRYDD